eukprot:574319-Rhodomonas_salina.5
MPLQLCYAMPGTDRVYAARHYRVKWRSEPFGPPKKTLLPAYALPKRCPALTHTADEFMNGDSPIG